MNIEVESKLLIVDDLPENLLALEALIRAPGRVVHRAASAEAALALLLEHEFALAIVDVQMPGMNGFELAELMRGTERTRHIPIIFVSAAGRELNYAFQGYESGAVDFLHKPLDPHAVTSKVNVFVDLHRHRKALRHEMDQLAVAHHKQEELVQQLQHTQRELERAVRMRDDFMSMVSHELRTPLNTLYLEAQLRQLHLSKGNLANFTPERLPSMIERDQRQIRNMVRLIDDMLDVTRMRRDALSIQTKPVDLSALSRAVVENLRQQAEAAGSPITLQTPAELRGVWDEFRIEQVLTNLLTNALRYGSGKPVEMTVSLEGDTARVAVRDQGIGIAPEDHARIFEQFERTDDSRRHAAGLGLGLYITRKIVSLHAGHIGVESAPGEGSRFVVDLPLHIPEADGDAAQPT
ncbi:MULTISPECIES: hybrid sensor histidine kinase/response regulator [Variovorax]|jgi:signal transduction histidine kinase|uniref:hybrid sensor histidine kinase/response regulator n=1 Tax=Variovorax TaxID=34072 RepID=UPI00086C1815|nr:MULTISPECIES: hybrid sensor histidine kinase/response regulator [Variovorax]MBN8751976.1 response regulator [Variovorax sp.]ODU17782.1 MAG: hybrid sensor histidine kinase/response regulator [Variovorax sp. SCN 67-85]ODV27139.1 MAG: hybrid sensor histidine kinase/response regulator [Variovorax sp. SCN 67-20]OJZ09205.1 MAG: hybrid sensor histidine kinase/response regulator [Variovorax sp. 67-131]UKI11678.1 hybrid sensor histidine kinase/response regulator [Variovorax paradoxus]